jgi:hypothetical protein
MNKKIKQTEDEVDEIVSSESEIDARWTKPIEVKRRLPVSLVIPGEIALRARFFSRLHGTGNLRDWLTRIIQERLDMEEAAYQEIKREFAKSR